MNFLSRVCVDIMGPKFKHIFVWPNLVMQAKGFCMWTRRRNKVIAFPQWKHIFSCLKSLATLFWSVWGGPFIIYCFSSERPQRIWYLVLCVFTCLSVLVGDGRHERYGYWHTYSASLCTRVCVSECGLRIDECVNACICLLPFIACSIFCIT